MLQTIDRAGKLLKLFTLEDPEWGITELAEALGLTTSTTYDLVSSLTHIGLLRKSGARRYRMGWRTLELSRVVLGSSTLQIEARKGMEEFASKYDETIQLGVLAGGKVLFADKIDSKQPLSSSMVALGVRLNTHCSAAGKVIMAHLSAEKRAAILDEHGLEPMTPKSIRSLDLLNSELERVQEQGHAYSFEESVIGLGCVAAPVFDFAGDVVAALSITTDIQHFERHLDEYREVIVYTAERVSRRLGHMAYKG